VPRLLMTMVFVESAASCAIDIGVCLPFDGALWILVPPARDQVVLSRIAHW
jgi:hypothetical protein